MSFALKSRTRGVSRGGLLAASTQHVVTREGVEVHEGEVEARRVVAVLRHDPVLRPHVLEAEHHAPVPERLAAQAREVHVRLLGLPLQTGQPALRALHVTGVTAGGSK